MVVISKTANDSLCSSISTGIAVLAVVGYIGIKGSIGILANLHKTEIIVVALLALCSHFAHNGLVAILAIAVKGVGCGIVTTGIVRYGTVGRIAIDDNLGSKCLCGIEIVIHIGLIAIAHTIGTIVTKHHDIVWIDVEQHTIEFTLHIVSGEVSSTGSVVLEVTEGKEFGEG